MEIEGLIRCRKELESEEIAVGSLTTDRHVSVEKYMKEHWRGPDHYFDLWHIAKGMTLTAL